jgi:hypothetical protein
MEAKSNAVQTTGCSEGLLRLKRQFDQWRAGRRAGQRIPAELWAGAVAAVGQDGAYRVATELHLDYAVLKRRAALACGKTPVAQCAPRFVELFAPVARTAQAGAEPPACVIEVDNARGAKMRVELGGSGLAAGLSVLCSAFWAAQ